MTSDSRRLAILTAPEIDELYGLPCFTDQERCIYFDLSPAEHDAVDAVHTDAAAVHMVLQLGYFKAKRQFFNFYRFGALGIFYQDWDAYIYDLAFCLERKLGVYL